MHVASIITFKVSLYEQIVPNHELGYCQNWLVVANLGELHNTNSIKA
jgi:hypothetical protein